MNRRELRATVLAPLVIAPVMLVYGTLLSRPPHFMTGMSQSMWALMCVGMGLACGYAAALLIGLPSHKLLARWHRYSLSTYLGLWFGSALVAWACALVAGFAREGLGLFYLADTVANRPYVPLSIGLVWAAVGGIFWLVARPRHVAAG